MSFLEIEETIEDLFEELYPKHLSGSRATKPLLAPALGCAVVDPNVRLLLPNRDYHQLDMFDFIDFATSSLPTVPRLHHFRNGTLSFYEGFDLKPTESMVSASQMGLGLSVLGAAIARDQVFVSVTMRFTVH